MNTNKLILVLLVVGTTLFNLLFWKESLGINLLLFSVFIIGSLIFINKGKRFSTPAKITSACTLLMSLAVILNHSSLSIVMYCISFVAMIEFVHQYELQLFFYGVFQSFFNLKFDGLKNILKDIFDSSGINVKKIFKYFKIGILPIIVLLVFYSLYYSANPLFASYSDTAFSRIRNFFTVGISFDRVLFIVLGLLITGMALWREQGSLLVEKNNLLSEKLCRARRGDCLKLGEMTTMGLKKEYQMAVVMFLMLNVLLLVVNIFDVNFIWFNFVENPDYNLKTYVHQGTHTLIVSILLAMLIIIYFFRNNLNFYKENEKLKWLTYIWIVQNGILAISLAVRTYRYIQFHGLAYKRIGVIVFLIAVVIGLVTMYIKVKEKRSLYFLINRNSWAVYLLLVISSLVNWDVAITKYNIFANTKRSLETHVLMYQLSDKNYYLLKEYNQEFFAKVNPKYEQQYFDMSCERKRLSILNRKVNKTWLSWNYADHKNLKAIESE